MKLVVNLEVKLKTFVFHMERGNGKIGMLLRIHAACHFSKDKVTFFCVG